MDDKATIRKRMRMVREMVDDRLMRSVAAVGRGRRAARVPAAATVMAFKGFGSEPDTDPLFARLAAEGKRLLLPRIERRRHRRRATATARWPRSRIGVDEPQGPALPFDVVEFVIVPGLAFTPDGYRLGYGGGFYDRFLPQRARCPNAGVCFAEQIVDRSARRSTRHPRPARRSAPERASLAFVVLAAEVGDLLLAHHPAQRVLQLGLLDEQVVLGVQAGGHHRGLVVEAQPLLDAARPARWARSLNSTRSSASGAARIESRQRKSTFICIG